jgi:hypothetical protein
MLAEGDHITDLSELENLSFYPKWEKKKTEALSYPRAKKKKKAFAGQGMSRLA